MTKDSGTIGSDGDLVSTQSPSGDSINTTSSSGEGPASITGSGVGLAASATVLDGGSELGGSSLPSLTSAELKALEDAVRAKIEYVLDLRGALDEKSTENPFFKALYKSLDAYGMAENLTDEKKYLDEISFMYDARIKCAENLKKKYGASVRNDAKGRHTKKYREKAEERERKAETFKYQAAINIAKIMNDKDKSNQDNQYLIEYWEEFKAVQKKADEMWQELCNAVDADINRPIS
jgi:hypothetical protein